MAAATLNCIILEYSLGFNPMLHELAVEPPIVRDGHMYIPDRPGLGVTLNQEFVRKYRVSYWVSFCSHFGSRGFHHRVPIGRTDC